MDIPLIPGQYPDIALVAGQYKMYCPAPAFDLPTQSVTYLYVHTLLIKSYLDCFIEYTYVHVSLWMQKEKLGYDWNLSQESNAHNWYINLWSNILLTLRPLILNFNSQCHIRTKYNLNNNNICYVLLKAFGECPTLIYIHRVYISLWNYHKI